MVWTKLSHVPANVAIFPKKHVRKDSKDSDAHQHASAAVGQEPPHWLCRHPWPRLPQDPCVSLVLIFGFLVQFYSANGLFPGFHGGMASRRIQTPCGLQTSVDFLEKAASANAQGRAETKFLSCPLYFLMSVR